MNDLYLLQDGTYAEPGDCSRGKDGALRNKNGLAVALYADGTPQTIFKDAEANKNNLAAKLAEPPAAPAPAEPRPAVRPGAPLMTTETLKGPAPGALMSHKVG